MHASQLLQGPRQGLLGQAAQQHPQRGQQGRHALGRAGTARALVAQGAHQQVEHAGGARQVGLAQFGGQCLALVEEGRAHAGTALQHPAGQPEPHLRQTLQCAGFQRMRRQLGHGCARCAPGLQCHQGAVRAGGGLAAATGRRQAASTRQAHGHFVGIGEFTDQRGRRLFQHGLETLCHPAQGLALGSAAEGPRHGLGIALQPWRDRGLCCLIGRHSAGQARAQAQQQGAQMVAGSIRRAAALQRGKARTRQGLDMAFDIGPGMAGIQLPGRRIQCRQGLCAALEQALVGPVGNGVIVQGAQPFLHHEDRPPCMAQASQSTRWSGVMAPICAPRSTSCAARSRS
ncbi:MAG: hypothetical protein GAK34_03646 [Delftia tsuruhatensis]|nr:MAG: hypothetical protein GAK34_03646 [Delftia tsuruhatensis]